MAFDLSTRQGSMALICKTSASSADLLEQRDWPNDRRNSGPFFRALDEIVRLRAAPEMLVVGLGPGSYTGTRIALSAAIGLHIACGAELRGLPSVCAMSSENDFVVIGDAKRASYFFSHIIDGVIARDIELLSGTEMSRRLSETEAPIYTADDLPQFDRAQLRFPSAELLCARAFTAKNLSRPPLEPIYLRAPHITSAEK